MKSSQSWVPGLVLALGLAALVVVPWIYALEFPKSPGSVFEDVVTFGSLARLVGFLSDLGIAMWVAMAMVLLSHLHQRLRHGPLLAPAEPGFYLFSGLFTLFLALDDRLMIHEWLTERWGLAEIWVMAAYGAAGAAGVWRYRLFWQGTSKWWLGWAAAGFLVSGAIDFGGIGGWVAGRVGESWAQVYEDGAKWVGICALLLYVFDLVADRAARKAL